MLSLFGWFYLSEERLYNSYAPRKIRCHKIEIRGVMRFVFYRFVMFRLFFHPNAALHIYRSSVVRVASRSVFSSEFINIWWRLCILHCCWAVFNRVVSYIQNWENLHNVFQTVHKSERTKQKNKTFGITSVCVCVRDVFLFTQKRSIHSWITSAVEKEN